MGAFLDHCTLGVFFLVIAIWWMIRSFTDFIRSRWRGEDYKSHLSYTIQCGNSGRLPMEAILKTLFLLAELTGEAIFLGHILSHDNHPDLFKAPSVIQRITVYSLFTVHSLLDLFTRLKWPVPPGADYLSGALGLAWFGGLISYGAHITDDMAKVAHILPVSMIYLAALCLLIEAWCRQSFMIHMIRIYSVLVMGSYFIHSAFVLYDPTQPTSPDPNPNWDRDDPKNIQAVVGIFGMHLNLHLATLTVIYMVSVCVLRMTGERDASSYAPITDRDVEKNE